MRRSPAIFRWLILLVAAFLAWPAATIANDDEPLPSLAYGDRSGGAQLRLRPYVELLGGVQGIRHERLDVFGSFGSLRVGAWVRPGIGVELFADAPVEVGDDNGFEAGVSDAKGVALRLQSPPTRRLAGYVLFGYTEFTIDQEPKRGGIELSERFTGPHFGVGLVERLAFLPALQISLEYRSYYVDEPVHVDALALGLRLDIR